MLVIFVFSTDFGALSSPLSNKINYEVKAKTGVNVSTRLGKHSLMVYFRKYAHFFEYTILGFLVYNVVIMLRVKHKYLTTFIFATIYAFTDEFHQLYVPNRTASYGDVAIDVLGGLLAIGIIFIINRTKNRRSIHES
jgi:VanZ family protein